MSHDIDTAAAGVLPDPNPTWEQYAVPADGTAPAEAPPAPADAVPDGAHIMPSGNWVQVIDAHTLTRRDKRDLIREVANGGHTNQVDQGLAIADQLHRRLITAWSYPHPLPSQDIGVLDLLPIEDDDALDNLIAEANRLMFPRPVTPDDHADPTSPTAPSGA